MKRSIRGLARQSAFYSLGNVAVKLGGLILAPVLLNPEYLEVANYGYLALLLVTAQLGVYVIGLGISSGLLRFWTHPDYRDRTETLATTALLLSTIVSVLVTGAIHVFLSDDIALALLDNPALSPIVGLALAYVCFKIIGSVPLTVFRVRERPLAYGAVQLLEVTLLVVLCIYWLVYSRRALEGVLLAYAVAAGITTVLSGAVVFMRMRWRFDSGLVRPLIRFGAPLALASLSAWVLNSSDRYLLKWLSDPLVIAEYDWASRVAGVVNVLIVQSFQLAFLVVGLRRLDDNDVTLHREMFRHYVVWTGMVTLAIAVLSGDAMQFMASVFGVDKSYVGISTIVLLVGIGFWAYGANQIVSSVLTGAGKTGTVAFCVGLAAFFNVLLNLMLIPSLGGIGAAGATALAFILMTAATTRFSERMTAVGYDWSLGAIALAIVLALFWVSTLAQDWSALWRLLFRTGIVMCYVPALLASRAYRFDEFRGGIATLRSVAGFGRSSAPPPAG